MKSACVVLSLVAAALAAELTTAPDGCASVNLDGSTEFSTIQSAIDSLVTTTAGTQCVFIYPGNYSEQVTVPWRADQLSVYGYTNDSSSYESNTVTITGNKSQLLNITNDDTATLRVRSPDFKLYNVNVENTFGEGSQAVALSAFEDSGYYGCQLWGYQDTLLAEHGRQLYAKTLIAGATDFIFGQRALDWFQNVAIRVIPPVSSQGYITGMIFLKSRSTC